MIKDFLYKEIPTSIAIGIILILVILVGGYTWWQYSEIRRDEADIPEVKAPEIGAKDCISDEFCVVFGEDGDCNCGCFNKNHNWEAEGACFCAAPSSCECVEGKCEGVFGEDEIADWEVYTNKKYGFEFKYPPVPDCGFCRVDEASEERFWINRTSVDVENLEGLTLSEFVDKKLGSIEMIESRGEILVGGEKGIVVAYRFGGADRYAQATFIEKDDKVIMASFSAGGFCCPDEKDEVYELRVYDAILSTFRFLD